jgi:hypothetical protein
MPDTTPLLPQVNLDDNMDAWRQADLPPTTDQVISADASSIMDQTKTFANRGLALAQNIPMVENLMNPNATGIDGQSVSAADNNPTLTPQQANDQYWKQGMPKFSVPISNDSARTLSEFQDQKNQSDSVIQRANMSMVGGRANSFARSALSMLDPLTIPMFLTPVVGEEALYGKLGEALGDGFFGKSATSLIRGAAEVTRGSLEMNALDYVTSEPLGQQHTLEDYAEDDAWNVLTATGLGVVGKAFAKTFSKGSDFFGKLDETTQESITNATGSDADVPINSRLDVDKNINEIEAQLGGDKLSAEDRVDLMAKKPNEEALAKGSDAYLDAIAKEGADSPTRPFTAQELIDKGEPELAEKVEKMGGDQIEQRSLDVKQASDNGELAPKDNAVEPENKLLIPESSPLADQEKATNGLLQQVMQMHKDLVDHLSEDPGKNAEHLSNLEEGMKKADDNIKRVSDQKSYVEAAAGCAMEALNSLS